jgi:hypothetical protein
VRAEEIDWRLLRRLDIDHGPRMRSGPSLPSTLVIAVALHQASRISLAMSGARTRLHLRIHQPVGREGQHLAHQVTIGALLDQLDKAPFCCRSSSSPF